MKIKSIVVLGIVIIFFSIGLKQYRFGWGYHSFIAWLVPGIIAGFAFSIAWLFNLSKKRKILNNLPLPRSFQTTVVFAFTLMFTLGSLGLAIIDFGRQNRQNSEAVKTWPRTDAKIVSTGLYESTPGKTGPRWWAATWSYTYVFQGKTWISQSTSAPLSYQLDPKSSSGEAKRDSERRGVGSTVTAFINPSNPNESVLDPKEINTAKMYLLIVLGALVLLCSLVGGYFVAKRSRYFS